jgi:hypothetical protein
MIEASHEMWAVRGTPHFTNLGGSVPVDKERGTTTNLDMDRPQQYEIRIRGHLDERWSDWFGGMTVTLDDSGDTLLTGPVVDQAALYGLLRKVRDVGMSLYSVNPLGLYAGSQE